MKPRLRTFEEGWRPGPEMKLPDQHVPMSRDPRYASARFKREFPEALMPNVPPGIHRPKR